MFKKLPATVLSGYLGARKKTLLNQILTNRQGFKVSVIVNDMSEININAQFIKADTANILTTQESLVEMQNGCICCTLRDDLLIVVRRLAIDTIVTASSLINDYHSDDFLQQRRQDLSEEDAQSVVKLLVGQIEFANVIILNKVDRVDADELGIAESIIKVLNPNAVLIKSTYGMVELKSILDIKLFDEEKAAQSSGWAKELTSKPFYH